VSEGSWIPTAKTGASWTINLSAGTGGGDGVLDVSDDIVEVALPSPTGAPWHVIYMERTWAGAGGASEFGSMPATSDGNIPADLLTAQDPGTVSKQPIALVQLVEGQTQPAQIIDLRVWAANGALTARSDKVTQYLYELGTQITVGSTVWSRISTLLGAVWTSHQTTMSPLQLFGAGQSLDPGGAAPFPTDVNFKIQAGTRVGPSDQVGYTMIRFPVPFPNGLLMAAAWNGDDSAANDITLNVAGGVWGTGNKALFVYRIWGPSGGGARTILSHFNHRSNWIAIGW
jgi:hypothetical protein